MRKKSLLTAGLILALSTAMIGCQNNNKKDEKPTTESTPTADKESSSNAIYTPGTYEGTATGFGGDVTVSITVDSSSITDITITADGETEGIGKDAAQKIAETIKTNKSESFDSISGATVTSKAISDALTKALAAAKGEEISYELKDGKYATKAMGHEDFIYVETMIQDGKITGCKVSAHEETMGIGNFAVSRIPTKIVEEGRINVDAISGATVSSNAIKSAVSDAIRQAGGNVADFEKESEAIAQSDETVEVSSDVVIMGAGTAGLVTAVRLLEQGKTVTVFEKNAIPGGSMATTYSGIMNSGAQLTANYGLGRQEGSASWDKELLLEVFKNYIHEEHDRFDKKQPYQDAMLTASGPMVDWLHDMGVGFASMGRFEGGLQYGLTPYLAPGCYQGGAGYALMFLEDRIKQLGGTIHYETPVTDIIMSEDNKKATGLVAKAKDGTTYRASGDAVVLASGGFAKNQEMLEKYYPDHAKYEFNACSGSTGDGILLAEKVGAQLECMGRDLGAFMSAYGSNYELAFMHSTTPGLLVNVNGDQFGNIMRGNHKMLANALMDEKNKETFYYIFDEATAPTVSDSDSYGFSYESVFHRNEAVRYETIEEASKALNLPNLKATIEKNNELALKGEADEFGRTNLPYVEPSQGIWAIRVIPTFYLTTGGVAIDTEARVLNTEGDSIDSLYAVGDVCGSIEEKDGKEYGNGFDQALSFGYLVVDTILEDLK